MALPKKTIPQIEQKRAAIYVRVSTQYQVDRASLPVQRSELVNYAKYALDIPDFVIFEDAGYSAKNTDRPDYQQMMARIITQANFLTCSCGRLTVSAAIFWISPQCTLS